MASLALVPIAPLRGKTACSPLPQLLYIVMRAWLIIGLLVGVPDMILADMAVGLLAVTHREDGDEVCAHVAAGSGDVTLIV